MNDNYKDLLTKHGQTHLIGYMDSLNSDEREKLFEDILKVDFSVIENASMTSERGRFSPIDVMTLVRSQARAQEFESLGADALSDKDHTFAAVMLAGGQGSRLGYSKPKGCYNLGETADYSLFESHIIDLKGLYRRTGTKVPLYIMTSSGNDAETREFFKQHDYFGYGEDFIRFYMQDDLPCTSPDGKLLLSSRTAVAAAPNGNGGWYSSLINAYGDELALRKVDYFCLFSVDNPLHRICDERFVGAFISSGCDGAMKVVAKAYPEEKVGVLCLEDGVVSTVSYSELSDDMRYAKDANGELVYRFGEIVNGLYTKKALDKTLGHPLKIHIAHKKIPYFGLDGKYYKPDEPNAYKYETFAFDLIAMMDSILPYEVVRENEFAPVKNREGADSPKTAKELLKMNGVIL